MNEISQTLIRFGWGKNPGGNQRALFKAACLTDYPRQRLYEAAFGLGLSTQQLEEWTSHWIVSSLCRGCSLWIKEEDFSIWNTYWQALWAPCHKECREAGMKLEAYDCQCIDMDCNDCKHFQRSVVVNEAMEPNEQLFKPVGGIPGNCLKHSKTVLAFPKRCSSNPCFEHRRG